MNFEYDKTTCIMNLYSISRRIETLRPRYTEYGSRYSSRRSTKSLFNMNPHCELFLTESLLPPVVTPCRSFNSRVVNLKKVVKFWQWGNRKTLGLAPVPSFWTPNTVKLIESLSNASITPSVTFAMETSRESFQTGLSVSFLCPVLWWSLFSPAKVHPYWTYKPCVKREL